MIDPFINECAQAPIDNDIHQRRQNAEQLMESNLYTALSVPSLLTISFPRSLTDDVPGPVLRLHVRFPDVLSDDPEAQ